MAVLGNNIFISVIEDGVARIIAGTKVNEIQTDTETLEISGPNIGSWRKHLTKRREWSFSTTFLVMSHEQVFNLLMTAETVNIQVVARINGSIVPLLQGEAIITQTKESFAKGKLAQGSWKFLGNGPLTVVSQSGGGVLE
jgi:predicted secreted protein